MGMESVVSFQQIYFLPHLTWPWTAIGKNPNEKKQIIIILTCMIDFRTYAYKYIHAPACIMQTKRVKRKIEFG